MCASSRLITLFQIIIFEREIEFYFCAMEKCEMSTADFRPVDSWRVLNDAVRQCFYPVIGDNYHDHDTQCRDVFVSL